jgi:hypothetical protein
MMVQNLIQSARQMHHALFGISAQQQTESVMLLALAREHAQTCEASIFLHRWGHLP